MQDLDYIIGRNARENTLLCQRGEPQDIWFHLEGVPSAHMIFRNPFKLTLKHFKKENIIYRLAQILKKHHQKYRHVRDIVVNYTFLKNVETTEIDGAVIIKRQFRVVI